MGPAISFPVILFLMQGNASSALDSATMQRIFAGVMAEFQGNKVWSGQYILFLDNQRIFFFKAAMNK